MKKHSNMSYHSQFYMEISAIEDRKHLSVGLVNGRKIKQLLKLAYICTYKNRVVRMILMCIDFLTRWRARMWRPTSIFSLNMSSRTPAWTLHGIVGSFGFDFLRQNCIIPITLLLTSNGELGTPW